MRAARAARQPVIKAAADLLSGPGRLASYLRTRLAPDIVASVSLPLDVGAVVESIPVRLRRAVAVRDRHCRWPGCEQRWRRVSRTTSSPGPWAGRRL